LSCLALPRQQVGYHLRALEQAGLVELVEERRKGNCIERIVRAAACSYVISPEARCSCPCAAPRPLAFSRMHCAVRPLTDGGVVGSAITFNSTDKAAPQFCCMRALVWKTIALTRICRRARWP
jgi:hypothetical protein